MSENDFFRQQQAAVERMREMNSRAAPEAYGRQMPPVPPFVKVQNTGNGVNQQNRKEFTGNENPQDEVHNQKNNSGTKPEQKENRPNDSRENKKNNGLLGGLNIPFLDMLGKDTDMTLIIGLLLILISEKADKKLLFALIYILM